MFATMFNKGATPALEKGMSFHVLRNSVLAQNIVNAETPYYKAKDVPLGEFRDLLRRAIQDRDDRPVGVLSIGRSRNVRPTRNGMASEIIPSPDPGILRHDENNVSMDKEMVKLSENTLMFNTLTQLLTHQFDLLETAIRERVR